MSFTFINGTYSSSFIVLIILVSIMMAGFVILFDVVYNKRYLQER